MRDALSGCVAVCLKLCLYWARVLERLPACLEHMPAQSSCFCLRHGHLFASLSVCLSCVCWDAYCRLYAAHPRVKGCGVPPPPPPTLSLCADGGADHVWVLPSAKKMAEALLQRPPAGSSAAVSPESISQYLCDKLTIPSASAFRCVSGWGSVLCCVVLRPRAAITCLVRWRIVRAAVVSCSCCFCPLVTHGCWCMSRW